MPGAIKILIVGNGFGGMYALKKLRKIYTRSKKQKIKISVVGVKDYFLFTPLLHEVATGGIKSRNIIEPIRKSLNGCFDELYVGEANLINLKEKSVEISEKSDENKPTVKKLFYDLLVLAPGSTTNFYDIPGAEKYSLTLKSLEDAKKIKNRCITQMENASQEKNREKRKKMLAFVVVGGGATGVEITAELYEFLKKTFSHHYPIDVIADISIKLIQKAPELLPQFGVKLRQKSLEALQKKGVEVFLGAGVVKVNEESVVLDSGITIFTENVIWVAGIKPANLKFDEIVPKLPDGRIMVNEYLQLENHKEVFIIGDVSAFKIKNTGMYVPALAQATVDEAKSVAKNIELRLGGKPTKEFVYRHTGDLVSLGYGMAIGQIANFEFSGKITWWIWRTVYLSKIISWKKKIRIAVEWTIDLFCSRDILPL